MENNENNQLESVTENNENSQLDSAVGDNENSRPDAVDVESQKAEKQSSKKSKYLAIGTAVVIAGVIAFAVIFSQFGGKKKVPMASVKSITEGMTYKEVAKELGRETSKEQITFDGNDAQMYTWPANLGDGKYELNIIFVDNKVVRVIQTTVAE